MHSPKITHSLRGYQAYLANQSKWIEGGDSFRQSKDRPAWAEFRRLGVRESTDEILDGGWEWWFKEIMKASLFALFVALLMVGCEKSSQSSEGVDMNDTVPKKDAIETAVDYDDLEYRNEVWYLPNEKTPFTGRAEGFYENGQKVAEGNYKDGEPDGLETHWFENGQKDWEANFKDGKKDGLSTWWYESGQKKEVQNYKDGEMEGLWTEWYRNGQKKRESSWKDGKVRSAEAWKPNGEKCPVTNLKDGNGVSVGYNEDGTELFRQTYKDGKRFRWLPPQVQTPQYPLPANPQ